MVFQNFNLRKNYNTESNQPVNTNLTPSASVLLKPKEVEIKGCKFIISQMPCTVAQEVACKLPPGLIPMIGNFSQAEEMYIKMLSYCERVYDDGRHIKLISKDIIDNNLPDFETLLLLEKEVIEHNFGFFDPGKLLTLLNDLLSHVESRASGMLTDLLDRLLSAEKQH